MDKEKTGQKEAEREYNNKRVRQWKRDNKERNKYMSYKSTAKLFIREYATDEDKEEILLMITNSNDEDHNK